jgi:endonuclease-3
MDVLPLKHWIGYNELLVSFGQKVCKPISPHCSTCPLEKKCPRIGVGKHR